jgi:chromosome segregation ATPase
MLHKLAALATVGVVGAGVYVGYPYLKVATKHTQEAIRDAIPPHVELDKIRVEVASLDGEVESIKGQLAKATVDFKILEDEITRLKGDIEAGEKFVMKKGEELKLASAAEKFPWNGLSLTLPEAKERLNSEVNRVKSRKAELKAKQNILETRLKNRDLLERQLATLIEQRTDLTTEIARLDAEIQQIKLEQMESKTVTNDGSRLDGVKKSLSDLKRRLAIQRETMNIAKKYESNDKVADKSVDEILSGLDDGSVKK